MEQPLVTIGIPAYKPDYIREAINSALAQSYNNVEVVVVDDKSPYDLKSIVDTFNDSRLHYYRNEKNLGYEDPANNWNRCLELAHGEYFALLCDDDLYEPEFISEMISLARKYPKIDIFRSKVRWINESNEVLGYYPTSPQYETCTNYMYDLFTGFRKQTITEFFYRTNAFRKCGGYAHLPKAMGSDWLTIFNVSWNGGIASTIKPLVSFRSSTANLSGKGQASKNIVEKITANNLFTIAVSKLIKGNEDSKIILDARRKQHDLQNKGVLASAHVKDFLYVYSHRRELNVKNRTFIAAIYHKVINLIKK